MVTDEQLDAYRQAGTMLRVVRDEQERTYDVRGTVVAWDEQCVLIRKRGAKTVVQLDRRHRYIPLEQSRDSIIDAQ